VTVSYLHMVSAVVTNAAPSNVVVTMDTAIASGTATAGDFTVMVGGSAATISGMASTSGTATDPGTVTLTLSAAVSAGEAVTVSYSKSGTASQNLASAAGAMESRPVGGEIRSANTVCPVNSCIYGSVITVQPTIPLVDSGNRRYTIHFASGTVQDAAGNPFGGLAKFPADYQFILSDVTPPLISSLSPLHNSTDALKSTDIVLTFVENVQAGSGSVVITPSEGNTHYDGVPYVNVPIQIDVRDQAKITFSGLVCTISLSYDLADTLGKKHTITMLPGTIVDEDQHPFLGFDSSEPNRTYFFRIADRTIPFITTFSPSQGGNNIATDSKVVLKFSEDIQIASGGNITLTPVSGIAQSIPVSSASVVISGATVTTTPPLPLNYDQLYTVTIASAALSDKYSSSPNSVLAVAGTTYQFKATIRLRFIFSQAIQIGTGFFRIFTVNGNRGTDVQITDTQRVNITGNTMTVVPIGIPADTEYYVSMGKDVLRDTHPTTPQGFAGAVFQYNYASGDHYLQFRYA